MSLYTYTLIVCTLPLSTPSSPIYISVGRWRAALLYNKQLVWANHVYGYSLVRVDRSTDRPDPQAMCYEAWLEL